MHYYGCHKLKELNLETKCTNVSDEQIVIYQCMKH